ncbi:1-hydroxycarotenoid 3,4-desaturase CrtD [Roseivivax lentus]|uniref:1-hydroxycarotenoid 3,4-desaturase CrtD n=1 Tax=Roseivivax lentus TaxID=633194 RepID=UPI0009711734|nr:1-hydroxycarotenoid 3,4-desaturase CrtD [Roseivivax lentus]
MNSETPFFPTTRHDPIIVIGAGIGGLAAALSLAAAGHAVHVLERAAMPGGKMRQIDGVDAGPTVLTMRWVFDALFEAAGTRIADHLTLVRQDVLARHFWQDGSVLDLFADHDRSVEAIRAMSGPKGAAEFDAFSARARRLFAAFRDPMMLAADPDPLALTRRVATDPRLLLDMAPWRSLDGLLRQGFTDHRLRQLFGRYATYIGGDPARVPALLALIWDAEASGVWAVDGGMTALAATLARLLEGFGAEISCDTHVARIVTDGDGVTGVETRDGRYVRAAQILFNGDPRALSTGALGDDMRRAIPDLTDAPRALSANVWSFRARISGPDLVHHNVFFRDDPRPEFDALSKGANAPDPTVYLCAEDRGIGHPVPEAERIELIVNAAPLGRSPSAPEDFAACQTRTFAALARHRLTVDPMPGPENLATPQDFATLFPESRGSLYGQSPHGLTAALSRPRARTRIPGLYLCGGGTHPGPGVPMAALSGRHAAAAIMTDRASTSRSRPMATRGGMSTASATTAAGPSRSSPS